MLGGAMRNVAMVGLLAMALMLVPAGVAAADDSSVYGAYVSRDADFSRLGKQLRRDIRAWVRSGRKEPAAALQTIRESRTALADVARAIKAEDSSSDDGKRGKAAAIASVRDLSRSLKVLGGGIRARTAGRIAAAKRLAKRADRLLSRSLKEQKAARKAFRAAGVQIK
jgi:hypothetical protein